MDSHFNYDGYGSAERPEDDPAAAERLASASRVGDELLEGRTEKQKEIAGRIYQQLRAGADVDDIKHLIGDLSRTATDDARHRKADRQAGGAR